MHIYAIVMVFVCSIFYGLYNILSRSYSKSFLCYIFKDKKEQKVNGMKKEE